MKADRTNNSGVSFIKKTIENLTTSSRNQQAPAANKTAPEMPEGYVTGNSSNTQALRSPGLSPVTVRMSSEATAPANKPFRFSKHSGPEINFPLTPSQAANLSNSNTVLDSGIYS